MAKLYETINAENWTKGVKETYDGRRRCLVGHLDKNVPRWWMSQEYVALVSAIDMLFPGRMQRGEAHLFNDHPDTTVEDVIRVCKVAGV